MKKEDAMKWINVLRSGQYKQGHGRLCNNDDNTYCCLGVLDKIFPELNLSGEDDTYTLYNYDEIGLKTPGGGIVFDSNNYIKISLWELNDNGLSSYNKIYNINNDFDGEKFNFDEIADVIQIEYVEGL